MPAETSQSRGSYLASLPPDHGPLFVTAYVELVPRSNLDTHELNLEIMNSWARRRSLHAYRLRDSLPSFFLRQPCLAIALIPTRSHLTG
jgi:hypothetical protein